VRGSSGEAHKRPDRGMPPFGLPVYNTFRRIYEPLEVGHKFVYDFQTLEYFLHCVGFVDIRKESFMRGRDPSLLIDYPKRARESLYVEAAKPRVRT
jgi:hypothetical protein